MALLAYYKFSDNAANTTIVDSSGNGLTAASAANTSTKSVAGRSGIANTALTFNGLSDVVTLPAGASLKNKSYMSISAWVKVTAFPTGSANIYYESTSVDGTTRISLYVTSAAKIAAAYRDSNSGTAFVITQAATISLGSWHHCVLTVNADTNNMILYIDGVAEPANTAAKGATTSDNPDDPITIGKFSGTSASYLNAVIDEVRVYDSELSAADVLTLYYPDFPATTDVRNAISFGDGGSTGNMTVPAVSAVQYGVQYGANGTEYSGTYEDRRYFKVP